MKYEFPDTYYLSINNFNIFVCIRKYIMIIYIFFETTHVICEFKIICINKVTTKIYTLRHQLQRVLLKKLCSLFGLLTLFSHNRITHIIHNTLREIPIVSVIGFDSTTMRLCGNASFQKIIQFS